MAFDIFNTCLLVPGVSEINCSGWVQAWGSILGLAVAIFLPLRQRRNEAAEQRETDIARAHVVATSVCLMANAAVACANTILEILSKNQPSFTTLDPRLVTEMLGSLRLPDQGQILVLMLVDRDLAVELAHGTLRLQQTQSSAAMLLGHTDQHKATKVLTELAPFLKEAVTSYSNASAKLLKFLSDHVSDTHATPPKVATEIATAKG